MSQNQKPELVLVTGYQRIFQHVCNNFPEMEIVNLKAFKKNRWKHANAARHLYTALFPEKR